MSVQWKDVRAEQAIRTQALALHVDGRARLRNFSPAERASLRRWQQRLADSEQSLAALETWQSCLRSVYLNMDQPRSRDWLPARDGSARIAHIADWLWEAGEAAMTEVGFVALTAVCARVLPLTYSEIWLIPHAMRLHALRSFAEDTRVLAKMAESRRAAEQYLSGGRWVPNDDIFAEAVLRASAESKHAAKCAQACELLEQTGDSAEAVIDRSHEQQSALILRMEKVRRMLKLLGDMQWQAHLLEISRTEQLLMQDPGKVYPRLTDFSRQLARKTLQQIASRCEMSEGQIARAAAQLCRDGHFADVTQVLLTDDGVNMLQNDLDIPQWRQFRLHVDPTGKWIISGSIALTIVLFLLFVALSGQFWTAIAGIPVFWKSARLLFNRMMAAIIPARPLPRMEIDRIPDDMRTLVVVPARIASQKELKARLEELSAYGALYPDEAMEYLLLADLPEAKSAQMPEDDALMEQSQRLVDELNRQKGRRCCHVLWRERSFNERDNLYQPKERKRGALMALYALLCGEQSSFLPHVTAERLRSGNFKYVITLDAETMIQPDSLRKLVGAMAWPGNRYAIIQPCMHSAMKMRPTSFDRMMAPDAGIGAYATAAGDLYQDMAGRGIFGGKGIVDVAAFRLALENRLPDNAILSHDLIEGAIAGAGFAGDIAWFEPQPGTLRGMLARFERWTRGDWQLLPFLLDQNQPLDALSRFQMVDNLFHSLTFQSALAMIGAAAWSGSLLAMIVPLAYLALPLLLHLDSIDQWRVKGLLAEICLLPVNAWTAFSAIWRALYRTYVSHEHMLDWKTAASADSGGGVNRWPGIGAAISLLPALLHPMMWAAAFALAGLFLLGASWVSMNQQPEDDEPLNDEQRQFLSELAQRTWRFFDEHVTAQNHYLPPDNVQVDPPIGAAHRTSPTNIGLYLLSCLSAEKLSLLAHCEAELRIDQTLTTLEQLPKWRGHLYNWYDTQTLQPLQPAYVSSVDSGNLAGCLLCLSAAEIAESLKRRARELARAMDFAALYDPARGLFHIGMDVAADALSPSYYDLYASESRILSLSAMAMGQIPAEHWARLGRPFAMLSEGPAHVSWSGTMFEYLMPELLFSAPAESAWSRSSRAVVDLQIDRAIDGMWGVSESGYCAFDLHMNYQYRAFGIDDVSFEGRAPAGVIAPYAAALALKYRPDKAAETLRRMAKHGHWTDCGMIEAIDFRTGAPQRVLSHMAHHQGMLLCAIANALNDDFLCRLTAQLPELRALQPLLQEKSEAHTRYRRPKLPQSAGKCTLRIEGREANSESDMHLMRGRDSEYAVDAAGNGRLTMQKMLVNRYLEDPDAEADGIALFVDCEDFSGALRHRQQVSTLMQPGSLMRTLRTDCLKLNATECLSPESGAWFLRLEVENRSPHAQKIRLTNAFIVAMMSPAEMRAHPTFHNLFIKSQRVGQHAVGFTRRSREAELDPRMLIHMAFGADSVEWETDAEKFYGRRYGALDDALAKQNLHGTLGHVIRPCSALCAQVSLAAGEKRCLHFAIGMTDEKAAGEWVKQHESDTAAQRAVRLAEAQAQALLSFIGISKDEYTPAERAARRLINATRGRAWHPMRKQELWPYGISGDRPMIGVRMTGEDGIPALQQICRIRAYFHLMGADTDLIIFSHAESGYRTPMADRIADIVQGAENVYSIDIDQCPQHAAIFSLCQLQFTARGKSVADQLASQWKQRRKPAQYPMLETLHAAQIDPLPENGYGRFLPEGEYEIITSAERQTPAPWGNILAGEGFGTLITERGGGFTWAKNSHDMRLTRFYNQALREGWSERLCLIDAQKQRRIDALPYPGNPLTFRVTHGPATTRFLPVLPELPFEVEMGVSAEYSAKMIVLRSQSDRSLRAEMHVDWLMGSAIDDVRFLCSRAQGHICFARGNMEGVGYLTCIGGKNISANGDGTAISADISNGSVCFLLGWAEDEHAAHRSIEAMEQTGAERLLQAAKETIAARQKVIRIETPDSQLNDFVNHMLPKQVFHSRVYGRTGLYQGGGAFGFRDQLQDMLCVLYFQPEMVRHHILNCAAHQFESGDVMHWWHPPYRGVRTKISDDMLFLPYVTNIYVQETGDTAIFDEQIPFLIDQPIPEGKEDIYFEAQPAAETASLREHCLRALERGHSLGQHGLVKIGSGDWNDGMNRVGLQGRGESIWLSQFLCHVIEQSLPWMTAGEQKTWQCRRNALMQAIEEHGWDGEWYLRAYDDHGDKLGSRESESMRIDCLSQAWAQLAGLNAKRTDSAISAVKAQLIDESLGIVRLLTPAFDMHLGDPGYIRAYPPGIRENGGQYTHAACWVLRALAHRGDAAWTWKVLQMMLPYNHAKTPEEAQLYRVEPYAMAADIGGEGMNAGRGGWTWYTGSAAWFYRVIVQDILGFEHRGNEVRMHMLPAPGWSSAKIVLQHGKSCYTLISNVQCCQITLDTLPQSSDWIELKDDGRDHIAEFPARK